MTRHNNDFSRHNNIAEHQFSEMISVSLRSEGWGSDAGGRRARRTRCTWYGSWRSRRRLPPSSVLRCCWFSAEDKSAAHSTHREVGIGRFPIPQPILPPPAPHFPSGSSPHGSPQFLPVPPAPEFPTVSAKFPTVDQVPPHFPLFRQ